MHVIVSSAYHLPAGLPGRSLSGSRSRFKVCSAARRAASIAQIWAMSGWAFVCLKRSSTTVPSVATRARIRQRSSSHRHAAVRCATPPESAMRYSVWIAFHKAFPGRPRPAGARGGLYGDPGNGITVEIFFNATPFHACWTRQRSAWVGIFEDFTPLPTIGCSINHSNRPHSSLA